MLWSSSSRNTTRSWLCLPISTLSSARKRRRQGPSWVRSGCETSWFQRWQSTSTGWTKIWSWLCLPSSAIPGAIQQRVKEPLQECECWTSTSWTKRWSWFGEKDGDDAGNVMTHVVNVLEFKNSDPFSWACEWVSTCWLTGIDHTTCTMCRTSTVWQPLFTEVTTSPFESVGQGWHRVETLFECVIIIVITIGVPALFERIPVFAGAWHRRVHFAHGDPQRASSGSSCIGVDCCMTTQFEVSRRRLQSHLFCSCSIDTLCIWVPGLFYAFVTAYNLQRTNRGPVFSASLCAEESKWWLLCVPRGLILIGRCALGFYPEQLRHEAFRLSKPKKILPCFLVVG